MKDGYIIDAPHVVVKFGDKNYVSLTATTGQIQGNSESIKIEGGQQMYPVFTMNTKQGLTATLTDARFDTNMFEAFGGKIASEKRKRYEMETVYTIPQSGKLEIKDRIIKAADLSINGLKAVDAESASVGTVDSGTVKVSTTVSNTTLHFNDDMKGKEIHPVYAYQEMAESLKFIENAFPKYGEVVYQFPLYEDENGNEGVPSTVQITIYKASIKMSPTIGGNYKTASTFQMEFEAMNPRRPDKEIWAIDVFENTAA